MRPLLILTILVLSAFTAITFFYDFQMFIIQAIVTLIITILFIVVIVGFKRFAYFYLRAVIKNLDANEKERLRQSPLPILLLDDCQKIIWYNDKFRNNVLNDNDMFGVLFSKLIYSVNVQDIILKPANLEYENKKYTVYANKQIEDDYVQYMVYFLEDTILKRTYNEYFLTRPVIILTIIDNMDELLQNAKESEKVQLKGKIENILEKHVGKTTGFFKKIGTDRFVTVIEERHLASMIESRFSILDEVRSVIVGDRMSATISMGVGRGADTIRECEEMASQSLDMALGRGGDQVAIKTKSGYEFYGGISKGIEKRTKVRTRIIASALAELVENSDNVMIMGHTASDLDSLGAAVGMWAGLKKLGKPVNIVIDRAKSLATPLIEKMTANGYDHLMISPDEAILMVTKKTTLIIVDTHRPDFLESRKLYEMAKDVVVIDHHRKMVDYIDNAVIFFHEPYASSASEMVTELLQYLNESGAGRLEAEALLAGIMLDTKNFVLRTGVRTFEAAAFLRRKGADTVEVKRLFSGSIDTYQKKSQLVSNAEIYKCYAISTAEQGGSDMRICMAQAADELLSINGVRASFVLNQENGTVTISARSMGELNVQVVMEKMGGGGHLTMAGAQIRDVSLDEARDRLITILDNGN